jgi:hypothetical protein
MWSSNANLKLPLMQDNDSARIDPEKLLQIRVKGNMGMKNAEWGMRNEECGLEARSQYSEVIGSEFGGLVSCPVLDAGVKMSG